MTDQEVFQNVKIIRFKAVMVFNSFILVCTKENLIEHWIPRKNISNVRSNPETPVSNLKSNSFPFCTFTFREKDQTYT